MTASRLVRLPGPARAVHVVPAYSARTLCGMTEHDTARMEIVGAPTAAGAWCGFCTSELAVLTAATS